MRRRARDVVDELFAAMRHTVLSYDAGAIAISAEIDGTAFFPGGTGLWRGGEPHGPMPECFPERPVMFVGHNFDSVDGHAALVRRGVEILERGIWAFLLQYLDRSGLRPGECFFTNPLVGL